MASEYSEQQDKLRPDLPGIGSNQIIDSSPSATYSGTDSMSLSKGIIFFMSLSVGTCYSKTDICLVSVC